MQERVKLHQGDCHDLLATIDSNSVNLIVTDPPYGVEYSSGRQVIDRKKSVAGEGNITCRHQYFDKIHNDKSIPLEWLNDAYRLLDSSGAMYIFTHWKSWGQLMNACEEAGFTVHNMIVLAKSNHGMGDLKGSFAPKHELLLFASKGKHQLRFPCGRENDVWSVNVKFSGAFRFHPNEKPLSWITPAIYNSSDEDGVVLDPFMGSGSIGVACAEMNRRFIGAEQDSNYFRIAKERIDEALEKRKNDIL